MEILQGGTGDLQGGTGGLWVALGSCLNLNRVMFQCCGDPAGWHWGPVCSTHIPPAAYPQVGALHAGTALPAAHHAQDNGQRCHLLLSPHPLHLHLQVSLTPLSSSVRLNSGQMSVSFSVFKCV